MQCALLLALLLWAIHAPAAAACSRPGCLPQLRGPSISGGRKLLQGGSPLLPGGGRPPAVTLEQLLGGLDVSRGGPGEVRVEVGGRPNNNNGANTSSEPELPAIVVNVRISDLFPPPSGRKALQHLPSSGSGAAALPAGISATGSGSHLSHHRQLLSGELPANVQQALQAMHATQVETRPTAARLGDLWCTDSSSAAITSSSSSTVDCSTGRSGARLNRRMLRSSDDDELDAVPAHLAADLKNLAGSSVASIRTQPKKTALRDVTGGSSTSTGGTTNNGGGDSSTGNHRHRRLAALPGSRVGEQQQQQQQGTPPASVGMPGGRLWSWASQLAAGAGMLTTPATATATPAALLAAAIPPAAAAAAAASRRSLAQHNLSQDEFLAAWGAANPSAGSSLAQLLGGSAIARSSAAAASSRATLVQLNSGGRHRRQLLQQDGAAQQGSSNAGGSTGSNSGSAGQSTTGGTSTTGNTQPNPAVQNQIRENWGTSKLWSSPPRASLCQLRGGGCP